MSGLCFSFLCLSGAITSVGQVSDSRWLKVDRMAVRNNLIMDALAVPNVGAEITLNDRWSLGGSYFHSGWSDESSHWCWRTYGGELEIRYWLGDKNTNLLTGHHFGLFSHILTYDFKRKNRDGYQSRFSYGADRKWYLPAIGQFSSMKDAEYPLQGDYWSSTAYNDNVNAYSYTAGAGSAKTDRMAGLKIRCVRVAD